MDFIQIYTLIKEFATLQNGAILIGVFFGIELFGRFISNEKIESAIKWLGQSLEPFEKVVGVGISVFLMKWLPRKIAEKAEEGVFGTLFTIFGSMLERIAKIPLNIKKHMTEDNKNSLGKKADK